MRLQTPIDVMITISEWMLQFSMNLINEFLVDADGKLYYNRITFDTSIRLSSRWTNRF